MSVGLCSLDLHQRAGAQCWHGGEGQQPLHGGHCPGDPGCSGGRSCAGLCRHETLAEEEERWASSMLRGPWSDLFMQLPPAVGGNLG